jgi:hypothetical protein
MQVFNDTAPRMVQRSEQLLAIGRLDICKKDAVMSWKTRSGRKRGHNL